MPREEEAQYLFGFFTAPEAAAARLCRGCERGCGIMGENGPHREAMYFEVEVDALTQHDDDDDDKMADFDKEDDDGDLLPSTSTSVGPRVRPHHRAHRAGPRRPGRG
ncbi:hypothetical protein ANANG_G00025790 [Anguilla anguilla]|uniref:Uncharacterized protein n=1 Tax=Anguilla anguilla TaxID=7936 RepID=A0A9D3MZM5_ANGAN|nr:hypothetical protein ANANG_G00025790 [Anguilla anguilla]